MSPKPGMLLILLTAAASLMAREGAYTTQLAAAVPASVEASSPADVEWRLHGNDWGEQRFSELDLINTDNVADLGLAWYFDMYTDRGVEATPLMVDGVLYVTSAWSIVYALDARSGELQWVHDPKVPREFLAKGCCDAVNRGVAYHDGRILASTYDGRLLSLDAETGEVQWEIQTTDRDQSYTITGAPRIAGDKVVIGNGGAELGVRGYVTAYDIGTGEQAWRFWTVPGNPEDGFETDVMKRAAETWNGEWWKWGGGGTAWDSLVYDPGLNLLYIGVGNGSPWNQKLRSPDGGDNLFLASIVAVQADTGEYLWHYQTAPGDTWDYTATQHMILADLEFEGRPRKVLMQAPKNGFFYVIDRETGELLSAEPYTLMTWATHVDKETGRPVETPKARLFDGDNVTIPSNAGGHNWHPMSYHPELGLVYLPTHVIPIQFKEPTATWDREPDRGYWNQGFDRTGYVLPVVANVEEILQEAVTGQLVAWDPLAGEPRWVGESGIGGGVLSTSGNLVFQGYVGRAKSIVELRALRADTGDVLWSDDLQTMAMAAPISYMLDGEQYVAVAVGFGGGLAAEGGPIAHGWDLDANLSRVMVYKLGGTASVPAQQDRRVPLPRPMPATADADAIALGQALYQRHCSVCHGDGLRTGGLTPDLKRSNPATHKLWQTIVLDGLLSNAGMVGFADYLSAVDAEAIRQYVLTLANEVYALQQSELAPDAAD